VPIWRLTACVALFVLALTSCATKSPPHQKERERKAAGVVLFRIHCSKDLWDRTGKDAGVSAKVTPEAGGLVTVELSGPSLVDLLKRMDFDAHGGLGHHDPLALRMYNAIAPRVDAIQAAPKPGDPAPEVTIDDRAGGVGTPTASASPKR
jgi:hypothetical protein